MPDISKNKKRNYKQSYIHVHKKGKMILNNAPRTYSEIHWLKGLVIGRFKSRYKNILGIVVSWYINQQKKKKKFNHRFFFALLYGINNLMQIKGTTLWHWLCINEPQIGFTS